MMYSSAHAAYAISAESSSSSRRSPAAAASTSSSSPVLIARGTAAPPTATGSPPPQRVDHDSDDEDGFVHVTKPMMTVRQFADWMAHVRLPDADAVMQGRVDEEDTIQALVARRTFLNDILRSFRGRVDDATGSVAEDAWPRLWSQFLRDFPREKIHVGGELLSAATDDSEAVETSVLPAIRDFIRSRMPPALKDVRAWQQRMAQLREQQQSQQTRARLGSTSPIGSALQYLNPFALFSHLGGLKSWPKGGGGDSSDDDAAARGGVRNDSSIFYSHAPQGVDDVVENYTRLVVLMSQQAVLALPLEIINAQFCTDVDAQLFVGEIPKDDAESSMAGMRVNLTPTPRREHGAVLSVSKLFRVFSVNDSVDYTLFYVEAKVEIELFNDDDQVSLIWRVYQAESPVHRVRKIDGHAVHARMCECLGAASGYHKPVCTLYRGDAAVTTNTDATRRRQNGPDGDDEVAEQAVDSADF